MNLSLVFLSVVGLYYDVIGLLLFEKLCYVVLYKSRCSMGLCVFKFLLLVVVLVVWRWYVFCVLLMLMLLLLIRLIIIFFSFCFIRL